MGNQCCDKQSKHIQGDQACTKVFDDRVVPDQRVNKNPPGYNSTAPQQHTTSNPNSRQESNNFNPGVFASVTPPSLKGDHPASVWNRLENGSEAPTQFFASNFGWGNRQSSSANPGVRSSVRFSYSNGAKSSIKNAGENSENSNKKVSGFGSQYLSKGGFRNNHKAEETA